MDRSSLWSAARAVVAHLPAPVRRRVETLGSLWGAGALDDPLAALEVLRHGHDLERVEQALVGQRLAALLLLGHEVGLYDALLAGPLPAAAVADACKLRPRAAETLCRLLESVGALERDGERFALASLGKLYLASASHYSTVAALDLASAEALAFPTILAGLRDGHPAPVLDARSPGGRHRALLGAVNAHLHWAARDLLAAAPLPTPSSMFTTAMGVSVAALVLERNARARVTFGDREHLAREIPALRARYGVPADRVAEGVELAGPVEGQPLGEEPIDLVFLPRVFLVEGGAAESWLRRAARALRPGGLLLLWETIHPAAGPTPQGRALEALLDLALAPEAEPLVDREIEGLLARLGFDRIRVVPALGERVSFVVGRKA